MDLRQLQALVAVEDHGTFSAAADALATVQSNVSTHVARLEKELKVTLVDRQAGRLTEEGKAVAERARRIQAELLAIVADVSALRHEVTGQVRVGIIGTTARWLVPRLLDVMGPRHPGVHLEIVDATSTSLEPQLINGRLDLAVVNLPVPDRELRTELLFSEDLLLFVPLDHRLAGEGEIELTALGDVELLLPPRGTALRDQLDGVAGEAGITLRTRADLDGIRLIASLIIAGHGASVLPATAVPEAMAGRARAVRVRGLPRREVGVATRRRGLPSAPTRAFLEVLRDVVTNDARQGAGLYLPAA